MTKAKPVKRRAKLIFTSKLAAGDQRVPACEGSEIDFVGPDLESNSDREYREAEAKSVCARCELRRECLMWSIGIEGNTFEVGVWGGYNDDQRKAIKTGRNYATAFGLPTAQQRYKIEREKRAWALYLDNRTQAEIAAELGVTEGTVYTYIRNQRRIKDHEARADQDAAKTSKAAQTRSSDTGRKDPSLLSKSGS